jgi:hypothetical protein
MTYLLVNVYATGSELNLSDQITIPLAVWEMMTLSVSSSGPCFVEVEDSGVFGRIVPGSAETVSGDACLVPRWMIDRLGIDEERWVSLAVTKLPMAGVVTLRAREEATLTEAEDPVTMLSEVLSSSYACLSVGSALPLVCGTFDIIGIEGLDGTSISGACILDTDVIMELIPALDHADTPTPSSAAATEPEKEEKPEAAVITTDMFPRLTQHRQQSQQQQQSQNRFQRRKSVVGFTPFSGVGRRTCDP